MTQTEAPTQAFRALLGDRPEPTLHWFEETKASMAFDPEATAPVIEEPQPWDLEEQYPRNLRQQVHDLTVSLGLQPEAAKNYTDWSDQYGEASEAGQAPGRVEPEAGRGAVELDPQCFGGNGSRWQDQVGEARVEVEPVPSQRGAALDSGA